jgi:hypothetical protein
MPKEVKTKEDEPEYKKWTIVVSTVVAVLSLVLNVFLGIFNFGLAKEKADIERKLSALELDKRELELLAKKQEVSVDLETRYLVVGGLGILDIDRSSIGGTAAAIVQNEVLQQLTIWKEAWGTGEKDIIIKENGIERSHGIVLLHISNRGKQVAHEVVLTVKQKDFPSGGSGSEDLWELDASRWKESSVKLADLSPGQSIVVPLAHVLGTSTYFGRVMMPSQIKWFNTTLKREESRSVSGMVTEDQWIVKGLNLKVAQ